MHDLLRLTARERAVASAGIEFACASNEPPGAMGIHRRSRSETTGMPTAARNCRKALAALALAAATAAAHAAEPAYPVRPVRLVIGFGVGGGVDMLARTIAPKMSEAMGHTWVVDNRTGASGNLSTEIVARANPDGHTILMTLNTQITANPSLYKLPVDLRRDLQPITSLGMSDQMIVVHPSVPATTLKEFIQLAKQKPGVLNYASTGIGSVDHLGMELFDKRAGINLVTLTSKDRAQRTETWRATGV